MPENIANGNASPVDHVVRVFGWKRAAQLVNLTENAVRKWRDRGGGRVPANYQPTYWHAARSAGLALSAEQLIGVPEDVQ